jgi:hypothetical protein
MRSLNADGQVFKFRACGHVDDGNVGDDGARYRAFLCGEKVSRERQHQEQCLHASTGAEK